MKYKEMIAKTALNKVKGGFPYKWDLNIYRGCIHKCEYCYAMYSHKYLDDNENFFETIYYKKNIAEILDKELSKKSMKNVVINIGSVCDSYQVIEKELEIMRDVLRVLIKHRNPIIISTKSLLILRDIDLLKELSEVASVNVAFTITTVDEKIRGKIEPNASSGINRFKALYKIKSETKATIGVHMMPIIPYYTDDYYNLRRIYKLANAINADYLLPGVLYLRGTTRKSFLEFVKNDNIYKYTNIIKLYQDKGENYKYKEGLYKVIKELEEEFNVSRDYRKKLNL